MKRYESCVVPILNVNGLSICSSSFVRKMIKYSLVLVWPANPVKQAMGKKQSGVHLFDLQILWNKRWGRGELKVEGLIRWIWKYVFFCVDENCQSLAGRERWFMWSCLTVSNNNNNNKQQFKKIYKKKGWRWGRGDLDHIYNFMPKGIVGKLFILKQCGCIFRRHEMFKFAVVVELTASTKVCHTKLWWSA